MLVRGAPLTRRSRRVWLLRLVLLFVLASLLLGLAEALLFTWSQLDPRLDAVLTRAPIPQAIADPLLAWRGNPIYAEHDAWGFRNPRVPARVDVVTFGDSQTYGLGERVSQAQTWPSTLAKTSALEVYNMAFPGWGSMQALELLPDALSLKPRVLILAVYSGNDLADNYVAVYLRGHLSTVPSTDADTRTALALRDQVDPWPNKIVNPVSLDPPRVRAPRRQQRSPLQGAVERSRIWTLVETSIAEIRRAPASVESSSRAPEVTDRDDLLFDNGSVRTIFNPDYRQLGLSQDDPRIVEGMRLTVEVARRLSQDAASAGSTLLVLQIPTKELVFAEAARRQGLAGSDAYWGLVAQEVRFWEALREGLHAHGILAGDALPTLRRMVEQGENPYSESADGHPNARGYRAIGEFAAAEVARL